MVVGLSCFRSYLAGGGNDLEEVRVRAPQGVGQRVANIRVGGHHRSADVLYCRRIFGNPVGNRLIGESRWVIRIGEGDGHGDGGEQAVRVGGGYRYFVSVFGLMVESGFGLQLSIGCVDGRRTRASDPPRE